MQFHDRVREPLFGPAQAIAIRPGVVGRVSQPARRLRTRPADGEAMCALRHPAAARSEVRNRYLGAGRRVLARDRRDGLDPEGPQLNVLDTQPPGETGVGGGHDQEHTVRRLAQLGGLTLGAVEHEERRASYSGQCRAEDDAHTLPLHLVRELGDETRAANSRRA